MRRVTAKGQVTIPQTEGNAGRPRRARVGKTRGEKLVARLRGRAERRLTTDQILRLTR